MPRLRANPTLTGGQIRLRSPGRVADFKWLGVFAVMLAATAIEGGLPVSDFGRAAIDFASRGGATVAVASQADAVGQTNERFAGLLTNVSTIDRGGGATDDNSDFVASYSIAAAGLLGKGPLKAQFCPWQRPRSHS